MNDTPRPTPEKVTPHGEDDEDLDEDPFLASISSEDVHPVASNAPRAQGSADADVSLYDWELALARKRRIAFGVAIVFATIAVPFVYLFLKGDLRGIQHRPKAAVGGSPRTGHSPQYALNGMITLEPTPPPPLTPAQIAHNKQVAQDLQNYLQQGSRTTPDEDIAMKALASVSGGNYKNNDVALQTVQGTVLPHYALFLAKISALHPQTPEVRAIHHVLLQSTRLKMLAFQHMREGLRAKDGDQLWQYGFRAELDQSTQFAQDYRAKITDLAAARGVALP